MAPRISILTIGVSDLDKAIAFYRDGLGWQSWSHPASPSEEPAEPLDHAGFEMASGLSFVLYAYSSLAGDAGESSNLPRGATQFILTHAVDTKADVDALLLKAETAGAVITSRPIKQPWGYTGEFKDLDGHLWQVTCDNA